MTNSAISNNRGTQELNDAGDLSTRVILGNQPIDVNATVTLGGAESPLITNLSLPTINTEVSHALQSGLSEVIIRNRSSDVLKMSFVSTQSGTIYLTIEAHCVLVLEGLKFTGKTIYIQSPAISTVEILELFT